jgi:multiple sugar transport system ATP-binding protein
MARVSLLNVSKSFAGDRGPWAVKDLSLDIADGELVALVGPSGCGKSTTLRMLAGLDEVTAGRIIIGDRDVTALPPKDRNVAMVFQNYALYPQKSVYDNMAFGLRVRGEASDEIDHRVRAAASSLGLETLLERKPRQLSGGQMQRVALGRALVRDPDCFLLDEPLSNLDAKLRVKMREEIAALHTRLGATMVFVTHDQVEAMTLGDRIVVMRDGLVQQVGPPLTLYDQPENLFVATFIGSPEMNLFECELVLERGILSVQCEQLRLELQSGTFSDRGRRVWLGIRPEHVLRVESPDALEMTVNLVEQVGAYTYAVGVVCNHTIRTVFERDDELTVKDKIGVWFPPRRLHLFDRDDEQSLALPASTTEATYGGMSHGNHERQSA